MWGWVGLHGRPCWGWDRVPPRWEPGEQDAGDHKGPPIHPSSALAPTEYPTPFREVDAYYSRLIRPRWMFGYPNDVVKVNLEHSQRARIVTSSMALPRGRATRALRAETRRVHRD